MTHPRLTVCTITRNSGERFESWAARVFDYADELVVLVDESSSDDTFDVVSRCADSVQLVENPPTAPDIYHDHAMRQARGEWILWLDDDEEMAPGFADLLPALTARPDLTHYWFPYRWLVRQPDGSLGWLRQFPWHPNPRLRMVRNIGGVFHHRGRQHSPLEVKGDGVVLDQPEAAMYHFDLVLRSRGEREAKVARYRRAEAPSCEEFYLIEEFGSTTPVEPAPLELADLSRSERAGLMLKERRERHDADPAHNVVTEVATVEQMRRHTAQFWAGADVFHASYLGHSTPESLFVNRGFTAEVTVRNTSEVRWRTSGEETGSVRLGYHWVHPEHGMVLRQGDRSLLPHSVEPGEAVTVSAGVWAPLDPGWYRLEWDLRVENERWFSDEGVAPLSVEVEVSDREIQPVRMRPVAELPPTVFDAGRSESAARRVGRLIERVRRRLARRAARFPDLAARNVKTIKPVRVLDTRNGSGVPGAARGPVPADGVVTLDVSEVVGADWVTGLVATVSVPEATYHGYLTVYEAERPDRGAGFVALYFGGGAAAAQVLTDVNRGRVSVHLSPGDGVAHLLVDVTGIVFGA